MSQIPAVVTSAIRSAGLSLDSLTEQLIAGEISLSRWQKECANEISLAHTTSAMAAMGGPTSIDADNPDGEANRQAIMDRIEFQLGCLHNLAQDYASEDISDDRLSARIGMYATAAGNTYQNVSRDQSDAPFERRVLNPGENCSECLDLAMEGWQPAGELPEIGSTPCGVNCNCEFEYSNSGKEDEDADAEDESADFGGPGSGRYPAGSSFSIGDHVALSADAKMEGGGVVMRHPRAGQSGTFSGHDEETGLATVAIGAKNVKVDPKYLTGSSASPAAGLKTSPEIFNPTDHVRHVTDAIDKHDNLADLVDVRAHLASRGVTDRANQDATIQLARRQGKVTASNYEGRHGLTPEQVAAGIPTEEGGRLGFLSRKTANFGGAGSGRYPAGSHEEEEPKPTKGRIKGIAEPTPSVKSQIAKDNAKLTDKVIQQYAEEYNEPRFAKVVGGVSLPNSEPVDVAISMPSSNKAAWQKESDRYHDEKASGVKPVPMNLKGAASHGVELKTMVDNKHSKITMDSYSQIRKILWEKEKGATFHTVVSDDRKVYNAQGVGKHGEEADRTYYYRRGVAGSARMESLYKCKNEAELLKLMNMPDKELPPEAQRTDGKHRVGTWKAFQDNQGKGFTNSETGVTFRAKK